MPEDIIYADSPEEAERIYRMREAQRKKPVIQGLQEPGNIDLTKRPIVRNADGSTSTVRSMSFEEGGREILVPTVSDDGRIMSDEEAIDTYRKTGRHLGKFSSPQTATAYAQRLHEDYAEGRIPGYRPANENPPESGGFWSGLKQALGRNRAFVGAIPATTRAIMQGAYGPGVEGLSQMPEGPQKEAAIKKMAAGAAGLATLPFGAPAAAISAGLAYATSKKPSDIVVSGMPIGGAATAIPAKTALRKLAVGGTSGAAEGLIANAIKQKMDTGEFRPELSPTPAAAGVVFGGLGRMAEAIPPTARQNFEAAVVKYVKPLKDLAGEKRSEFLGAMKEAFDTKKSLVSFQNWMKKTFPKSKSVESAIQSIGEKDAEAARAALAQQDRVRGEMGLVSAQIAGKKKTLEGLEVPQATAPRAAPPKMELTEEKILAQLDDKERAAWKNAKQRETATGKPDRMIATFTNRAKQRMGTQALLEESLQQVGGTDFRVMIPREKEALASLQRDYQKLSDDLDVITATRAAEQRRVIDLRKELESGVALRKNYEDQRAAASVLGNARKIALNDAEQTIKRLMEQYGIKESAQIFDKMSADVLAGVLSKASSLAGGAGMGGLLRAAGWIAYGSPEAISRGARAVGRNVIPAVDPGLRRTVTIGSEYLREPPAREGKRKKSIFTVQ